MNKHKGQAIVEFALLLPLFLLLLYGVIYSGMMFHDYITLSNIARSGAREAAVTSEEPANNGRYSNIESHYANQIDGLMTSLYVKGNPPIIIQNVNNGEGINASVNMTVNVHGFFVDIILPQSFGVQYYMAKEP